MRIRVFSKIFKIKSKWIIATNLISISVATYPAIHLCSSKVFFVAAGHKLWSHYSGSPLATQTLFGFYKGSMDTKTNPHRPNTSIQQTKQKQITSLQSSNLSSLVLPAPGPPAAHPPVSPCPGEGAGAPSQFHLLTQWAPGWNGLLGVQGQDHSLSWPRSAPSEP